MGNTSTTEEKQMLILKKMEVSFVVQYSLETLIEKGDRKNEAFRRRQLTPFFIVIYPNIVSTCCYYNLIVMIKNMVLHKITIFAGDIVTKSTEFILITVGHTGEMKRCQRV